MIFSKKIHPGGRYMTSCGPTVVCMMVCSALASMNAFAASVVTVSSQWYARGKSHLAPPPDLD
eukprot:6886507-Prorocentrum_lima.AAC.1